MSAILHERDAFHRYLVEQEILTLSPFSKYNVLHVCSNADTGQKHSVVVANLIAQKISDNLDLALVQRSKKKDGQTLGNSFEEACTIYLQKTFNKLTSLRPGTWHIEKINSRRLSVIGQYEQYTHLAELDRLASEHSELKAFLGDGYTVSPDIIIARIPEKDNIINVTEELVCKNSALQTMLRASNHENPESPAPILHASISCKFTMRSDRAQNTRTEALNLIRARKGRSPHIVSLTSEPTVSRIASLALGTGDLDCVYHFALYELQEALEELGADDSLELLNSMTKGKRLKDISDLPLDLTI